MKQAVRSSKSMTAKKSRRKFDMSDGTIHYLGRCSRLVGRALVSVDGYDFPEPQHIAEIQQLLVDSKCNVEGTYDRVRPFVTMQRWNSHGDI